MKLGWPLLKPVCVLVLRMLAPLSPFKLLALVRLLKGGARSDSDGDGDKLLADELPLPDPTGMPSEWEEEAKWGDEGGEDELSILVKRGKP